MKKRARENKRKRAHQYQIAQRRAARRVREAPLAASRAPQVAQAMRRPEPRQNILETIFEFPGVLIGMGVRAITPRSPLMAPDVIEAPRDSFRELTDKLKEMSD